MFKNYHEFIPQSFSLLKGYSFSLFRKDVIAGFTVGILGIPLVMAFAIASGVSPEKGLFTAIIGGFVVGLLGGCSVQVVGPTAAFIAVVYATLQKHGYEGLVLATVLASLFLFIMGFCRLGSLIKYIPHPLIIGFTSGIAVIVATSQVKGFFGLHLASVPADFLPKWGAFIAAAPTFEWPTLLIGLFTLGIILVLRKIRPTLPWGLISITAATLACWALGISTETIESRFGQMPRFLPAPSFSVDFTKLTVVIPDAITIALLAGLQALLSAVIADNITGEKHRPNCELIALGFANIGTVLFGGLPATAAIARTATNIRMGGKTPVASMVHSLTILAVLVLLAPIVGQIPLSALAAVLLVVAWTISEVPAFIRNLRSTKGDAAILLAAFFLTVLVDLTVAVEVGMVMAALIFMKRMGDQKQVVAAHTLQPQHEVQVYEVKGPLFFGVADRLKDLFEKHAPPPKTCILRMTHVPVMDASGIHALKEFYVRCKKEGTQLVLVEVQTEPARLVEKFGLGHLIDRVKEKNIH